MGIVASLLAAPYVGSIPSQVSTWAASFREKRVSLVAPEHVSNVASSPSELVMRRLVIEAKHEEVAITSPALLLLC